MANSERPGRTSPFRGGAGRSGIGRKHVTQHAVADVARHPGTVKSGKTGPALTRENGLTLSE